MLMQTIPSFRRALARPTLYYQITARPDDRRHGTDNIRRRLRMIERVVNPDHIELTPFEDRGQIFAVALNQAAIRRVPVFSEELKITVRQRIDGSQIEKTRNVPPGQHGKRTGANVENIRQIGRRRAPQAVKIRH